MTMRKTIPAAVIAEITAASRRRCCLCFALTQDHNQKRGQIAHLDHNPSNNAPDNLAFLCLLHHDEYDTPPSQSKGFTIHEVKRYRSALVAFVDQMLPLTREIDDVREEPFNEKLEKTLALLNEFRNTLPKHSLDLTDVDEYHSLLEKVQKELSCDLEEFRIPKNAIKTREIPQSFSMDMFGHSFGEPYRHEEYIPVSYFQRQIGALLSFLDRSQR